MSEYPHGVTLSAGGTSGVCFGGWLSQIRWAADIVPSSSAHAVDAAAAVGKSFTDGVGSAGGSAGGPAAASEPGSSTHH